MDIQTHRFTWNDEVQDIEIEVLYAPLKWGVISHFEIRSRKPDKAPLPITNTGYLSHYFDPNIVDFSDIGVVQFISDWLDREAAMSKWQERIECERQHSLF